MTTFRPGDLVVLIDAKDRRYLETLQPGAEFHTHHGVVDHDSIIGSFEGLTVSSSRGGVYSVIRPTLEDFILQMPRGAQVIYPKDISQILGLLDVRSGDRVFETGVGSGALSMGLLRAGAWVTGYEIREDFATRARRNVTAFLGEEAAKRHDIVIADSYEGVADGEFDKVALDIPEPWRVIPHLPTSIRRGGLLVAYTPSITQVQRVHDAMKDGWMDVRTLEVLVRTWHVEGQAVRPDHRMVAHTAFLTVGRWVGR
jgi:tRNA (adenine57-N1/adenine58-N1)-methyltransferase